VVESDRLEQETLGLERRALGRYSARGGGLADWPSVFVGPTQMV
jgi:hypothetical protein